MAGWPLGGIFIVLSLQIILLYSPWNKAQNSAHLCSRLMLCSTRSVDIQSRVLCNQTVTVSRHWGGVGTMFGSGQRDRQLDIQIVRQLDRNRTADKRFMNLNQGGVCLCAVCPVLSPAGTQRKQFSSTPCKGHSINTINIGISQIINLFAAIRLQYVEQIQFGAIPGIPVPVVQSQYRSSPIKSVGVHNSASQHKMNSS